MLQTLEVILNSLDGLACVIHRALQISDKVPLLYLGQVQVVEVHDNHALRIHLVLQIALEHTGILLQICDIAIICLEGFVDSGDEERIILQNFFQLALPVLQ